MTGYIGSFKGLCKAIEGPLKDSVRLCRSPFKGSVRLYDIGSCKGPCKAIEGPLQGLCKAM